MDFTCTVLDSARPERSRIRREYSQLAHQPLLTQRQADVHSRAEGQERTDSMEEAARIITKAFGLCLTDRTSPPDQSRKWGVYYIVGLVLKCYFRVCILDVCLVHFLTRSPGQAHFSVEEHPPCA